MCWMCDWCIAMLLHAANDNRQIIVTCQNVMKYTEYIDTNNNSCKMSCRNYYLDW